jgi:hypothetical protein
LDLRVSRSTFSKGAEALNLMKQGSPSLTGCFGT